MLTVLVSLRVKQDQVDAFITATLEDVRTSLRDAGVIRFEVIQQSDDPTHVILYEVYQTREDGLAHLETEHFKNWQATIKSMLVKPPQATTYGQIFPAPK